MQNSAQSGDFVPAQGDFRVACAMVEFLRDRGVICVYAAGKREVARYEDREDSQTFCFLPCDV